jgi:hypothetical protein
MRRVICNVRHNELLTQKQDYPPWELPILRLIHKDQVEELETIQTADPVPDPGIEFERLQRRYGFDKETHQPRVEIVYGSAPLGVQRLAEAMKLDLEQQAEADEIMHGPVAEDAPPTGKRRRASE